MNHLGVRADLLFGCSLSSPTRGVCVQFLWLLIPVLLSVVGVTVLVVLSRRRLPSPRELGALLSEPDERDLSATRAGRRRGR